MRTKLTIAAALGAFLLTAVAAQAGPVTVALYRFQSGGDVKAFYKVKGKNCGKAWRKRKTLGLVVGKQTNACGFRSSVVGDSSDSAPDQEMVAAVNMAVATPRYLRKKIYMGVAVRQSRTASYELRLLPSGRNWSLWRDPAGAGGAVRIGFGRGKVVKFGPGVRNWIKLRVFDFGKDSPWVAAFVNGTKVYQQLDERPNTPNGRRTVVTVGATGRAYAKKAVVAFDNVAIRVPFPFRG